MIVCSGASKQGMRVQRHSHTVALEPALLELMRLYDRLGGPTAEASSDIEREIERSLGERTVGRERMQAHLQQLLRARDLHVYVCEDADLIPLKLQLCEHLLYHRAAGDRWAAVRELLLEHLDRICQTPMPGLAANLELYKRHLSDRGSRLGKLLLTVAMFNLDLEGEAPPPNLLLRFRRGRFPHHWWEICTPDGRTTHLGAVESWTPSSALCRWEYLATDLTHSLYRRMQEDARQRRGGRHAAPAPPDATETLRGVETLRTAATTAETIYYRFDADTAEAGPAQLELFPLDTGTLLAGLLRRVHKQLGPEGGKLLAALCVQLDAPASPGAAPTVCELSLPAIAAEAGLGDLSARGMRTRIQRLERIAEELQRVELTRVSPAGEGSRARTSRLLTVLGRSGAWSGAAHPAGEERADATLHVMLDPCVHALPGGGLCEAFQTLPPVLMECAGKEHPCLLPLYVWLRRAWAGAAPGEPAAAVERTGHALLQESGVWVSETGRYRAIEALKRDLEFMREQGWLGSWRLQRSEQRDAMEDRYRLCAPGVARQATSAAVPRLLAPDGWEEARTGS